MSKVAFQNGASGLATVTLLGVAGMALRIKGAMGTSGSTAGTNLMPMIAFTNVLSDSGATFTAFVSSPEGGAAANLMRAVTWFPRATQHFDVAQGVNTVCVYTSGVSTSTPQLVVWYDTY